MSCRKLIQSSFREREFHCYQINIENWISDLTASSKDFLGHQCSFLISHVNFCRYFRFKLVNTTPFINGPYIQDTHSLCWIKETSTGTEKTSRHISSLRVFHVHVPTDSSAKEHEDSFFKRTYAPVPTARITQFFWSSTWLWNNLLLIPASSEGNIFGLYRALWLHFFSCAHAIVYHRVGEANIEIWVRQCQRFALYKVLSEFWVRLPVKL